MGWLRSKWSVALIMIHSLCRGLLLSRCCLFLAATGTATGRMNTRRRRISGAGCLCLPKRSPRLRVETLRGGASLLLLEAADFGVAGLEDVVDEIAALVIGEECAFHGVDGEYFEVVEGQAKGVGGGLEFLGHGGVAHQAVVGIQRDAEFLLIESFEGMLGEAARGAGLHVAEQADFQRNSFVENVLRDVAQFDDFAVFGDGDVVDEAGAVADAVRAAVLNGLPDRFFSVTFAGVNGDAEILALNVVKSFDVFFWRIAAFFAGEIETDDTAI